jgi:hypothetical protein
MSFEISGRLAERFETQKVSDRFQKREFVLEIKSTGNTGYEFVDFIKFQATQDKCSLLDQFGIDEEVKVSFNLRGRKWEKDGQISYFTNLEAWRVEKVQNVSNTSPTESSAPAQDSFSAQDAPFPTQAPQDDSGDDDLPF